MADTRGIRAGRAFVELGVSDKLSAGLRRAQKRLKAFGDGLRSVGTRLTAIGAGAVASLLSTVKVFTAMGDTLDKMSKRTGVSVESLSELGFAAEQSGADLATFEKGVRSMQRSINDLGRGLSTQTDAFATLGLTMADLDGLSPEAQFKLIAERLSQIEDPIALAAEILWLSLKVIWQKGVAALNSAWLEARRFFVSTAQSMWYGALAAAQIVLHALEVGWIETTAFLSKTWSRFTGGFQKAWESASSFVAKRMLEIQGLFDDGLDVEAAKKAVDEQLEQRLGEIDDRTRAALAEREARRSSERDRSSELNDATLSEIGKQYEDAQKALDVQTDERVTDAQRELEEARKRLDDAIEEARKRREEAEAEPDSRPRNLLAEFEDRLRGIGDLVAEGISVRGTFNASAVQGLASDDAVAERTAKATEQTAKHTRQLADAAKSGGLTFA